MRKAALLLLLAPAACFSASSGGGGPDANFDVNLDAEFTDSGTVEPDASVDSAAMDVTVVEAAPPPDAPVEAAGPKPVTVVVTNAAGPEPGVTVVFQDATGVPLLAPAMTGAAGSVSTQVASGGQVTVVMGTAAAPYLFTVQSIAQGDTIAVYDPTLDATLSTGQVSIDSWPDAGQFDAGTYEAWIGRCINATVTPPLVDNLFAGCEAAGKYPILLEALDTTTGTPLAYTWQKGNAVPGDAGIAHVDLTSPWTTNTQSQTVIATTPPPFVIGASTGLAFTMVTGGVPTVQTNSFGAFADVDASASYDFMYPTGYPDTIQAETNVYTNGSVSKSVTAIATRGAPPGDSGATAFDLSQLLPYVASASLDTTSVTQPVVTWGVDDAGSVASADGIVVTLHWTDSSTSAIGYWTVVAPPTASKVGVPALPVSLAGFGPGATTASYASTPTVAFVQASFISGYGGLRAQAGTAQLTTLIATSYSSGASVPPLPADGTLQMTAITVSGD